MSCRDEPDRKHLIGHVRVGQVGDADALALVARRAQPDSGTGVRRVFLCVSTRHSGHPWCPRCTGSWPGYLGRYLAPPLLTLVGVRCPELLALLEIPLPGEVRRARVYRVGVQHHDRTQGRRLLDRTPPRAKLVGSLEERDHGPRDRPRTRPARGERVVDRHRDRGGVDPGDVGEQVLGAIGRHDRDRVAGRTPSATSPAAPSRARLAHLRPGERAPAGAVDTILSEYAGCRRTGAVSASASTRVRPSTSSSISLRATALVMGPLLTVRGPADDLLLDLGGAAVDRGDAAVEVGLRDRELHHVAVAAVELDALVDQLVLQLGGPPLRHRGVAASSLPSRCCRCTR